MRFACALSWTWTLRGQLLEGGKKKKLLLFVVRNAEKCVIYVGGRRGGEMRMIVEFIHVYGSMKKSRAIVLGGVCVCVWIMEGRIRCR